MKMLKDIFSWNLIWYAKILARGVLLNVPYITDAVQSSYSDCVIWTNEVNL